MRLRNLIGNLIKKDHIRPASTEPTGSPPRSSTSAQRRPSTSAQSRPSSVAQVRPSTPTSNAPTRQSKESISANDPYTATPAISATTTTTTTDTINTALENPFLRTPSPPLVQPPVTANPIKRMLSIKTGTTRPAAAAAAMARPPPGPSKTTERLEKQRKTFEDAHALLVGQRERLEQLERTRMDADVARLVMRKHMVQQPHPEPSGEMRAMYWAAVCENRATYIEAVNRENELEVSLPLCISQIRSQLRTPAGATREEAEMRRVRLLELLEEFVTEIEAIRKEGGRLDPDEVHCGERYRQLEMVIEGVRRTYFME
ncbi:hypothetical protein DIS24_g6604 [Lasiodiplodia hormozganensis]|uniref:Uncharacterized protein n=1 Tax=Lasiodiplodia hormozganensis TaxID=869390 RepID=A0AA40CVF6_9PEZI|nr:hypothetical protein DIS24_g6604 [Lasiodiplodia hormozganensis]